MKRRADSYQWQNIKASGEVQRWHYSLQSETSASAAFQSIIAILSQLCDLSLPFAAEGICVNISYEKNP